MSTPIPTTVSAVDSTLIATAVSAIISVAILLLSNYLIQPRRFKKVRKVENLEKRLEAYGTLITIIDSMQAKGERLPSRTSNISAKRFAMENPFDYNRLLAILESKNYLISKDISQLWFKILKQDTTMLIYTSLTEGGIGAIVDFKEMQESAKKEYSELKTEYEKLTGIELPN